MLTLEVAPVIITHPSFKRDQPSPCGSVFAIYANSTVEGTDVAAIVQVYSLSAYACDSVV